MPASDVVRRLDRVLNPRVVAVVGDKGPGYSWLNNMKTFQGKVYSVQIDPNEIPGIEAMGVRNYKSLMEVPEEIDYVLVAVPRPVAPRVLADCIQKGVGGAAFFTSGFAETGEEDGIKLQQAMTEMARNADFLVIGPNCMGIYNRRLGVRHAGEQPAGDSGNVGFISQSGTHCISFSMVGAASGIKCSKTISFGNAIVLDASDYLEYLAQDPETEVIGLYIEGVKDGRRFFSVLREAANRKPVVVWKGGQTEAGQRAIYSHTASLASPKAIWDSVMKQCGVITVDGLDEMIDVMKVLLNAKPTTGRGAALITQTGGPSVSITDSFAKAGLDVPLLTDESYAKLASFFNVIGGSFRNPLDAGGTIGGMRGQQENLNKILDILEEDPNVSMIVMEVATAFLGRSLQQNPEAINSMLDTLAAFKERSLKPFVTVVHPAHIEAVASEVRAKVIERGIPAIHTYDRAALALSRVIAYHRRRAGLDD